MCSSPVYPTSAPLGDHITGDRSAPTRSEDVTDISSKGLLPQLIDVLHALTQGQELLSRKVRDARLEHSLHSATTIERRPQAEPVDDPSSRVSRSPDGSTEVHGIPPTTKGELGAGHTSIDVVGNAPSPEPAGGTATAPEIASAVPDSTSRSDASESIATPSGVVADASSEASAPHNELNSAQPAETTIKEPLKRDYNFFDELDARLAELKDQADGPDR